MPKMVISGIEIIYHNIDHETTALVYRTVELTNRWLNEYWQLPTPSDCRLYLMTSWLSFSFQAPPWPWKIYSALTLPLWAGRARRTWKQAGGWAQAYGRRHAIGVKPPLLLRQVASGFSGRIFIEESPEEMLQRIICHELTHAFSEHLHLPAWLNEGIAMLAQDHYFDRQTIRPQTLLILQEQTCKKRPPSQLSFNDPDGIVCLYARGYWLTRYLDEKEPALLKELLAFPRQVEEVEALLAKNFGQTSDEFWEQIDNILVSSMPSDPLE